MYGWFSKCFHILQSMILNIIYQPYHSQNLIKIWFGLTSISMIQILSHNIFHIKDKYQLLSIWVWSEQNFLFLLIQFYRFLQPGCQFLGSGVICILSHTNVPPLTYHISSTSTLRNTNYAHMSVDEANPSIISESPKEYAELPEKAANDHRINRKLIDPVAHWTGPDRPLSGGEQHALLVGQGNFISPT